MNLPTRFTALCLALVFPVALVAATPPLVAPVGPDTGAAGEQAVGGIRVYSGRPSTAMGADAAQVYQNTAYEIRTPDGALVETVPNAYGERKGDRPALITLAPGAYHLVAYSAQQGLVTVPVTIAAGRTTTVRLDRKS